MSAERVLVTGAAGFIGRHCLSELKTRGYEIHAITSRTPAVASDVHWHQVDLLNAAQTTALLAELRPDNLLHLAWYAKHGLFWQALENLDWVSASLTLLRAFVAHGGRRVVCAGSCAEYDWAHGYCNENTTPLRPQSLYGASKHAFHSVAAEAARRSGISLAWGRIFFLYGPGEQGTRLVPLIVRSQLCGDPVTCSIGTQRRDYLYVADVAAALVTLLDSAVEGPVNIGSGNALPVRGIVDQIVARAGHPELIQFAQTDTPQIEAPLVVADTTRLAGELQWKPRIEFDRGIDLTIEWWRQHLHARL